MSKPRSNANLLDWTFSEAPTADEPTWGEARFPSTPGGPSPRPVAPAGRHPLAWFLPGMLVGLALAATAALPSLQAWWAHRAVERLVAQQEQARLAGDWDAVRGTFREPRGDWAAVQTERLHTGWQAAAFGLPGARLSPQPGRILHYQALTAEWVRADVARTYLLADGSQALFALPQYYQYRDGAWRQAPAPPAPAGDLEALRRAQVDVHFNPADAEWAAQVADDLQLLLTRACADWGCPLHLRVAVVFGSPDPGCETDPAQAGALPDSLTYQMLAAGQPRLPDLAVDLPTREWAGYPADAAAMAAVQRVVAVQVLANVGERLSGGMPAGGGPAQPLRYALIVRELARLGVEPPSLLTLDQAPLLADPGRLWSANDPAAWRALPAALATVDGLLAGRSLDDERRLLRWLPLAPDMTAWVAEGLELTPEQAQAHLAELWQD